MKIVASLCLTVVAACGFATTAAAQETLKDAPYYPLKLGTTWQFKGGTVTLDVAVARFEPIGSRTCAALEWSVAGKLISREDVIVTNDGVYRCAYDNKPVDPPLRFLKLPPVNGDSWKVDSKIEGISMVGTFQLRAEDVTVPAGRFNAFASSTTDMLINGQGGLFTTYWFASGPGLVRQLLKANGKETLFNLVKYTPGK